ncbi:hypothetical protein [Embleya sp. NPDC001921]
MERRRTKAGREATLALPTVELRRHAVIAGRPDEERVAASVGPDGNVVALWALRRDLPMLVSATTWSGGATFPDPRAARPVTVRVSTHAPDPTGSVELAGLELAHVTVQPLPEGRILVVGARARWHPDGPDRNAIVHDGDGRVVAETTLGDGIRHVLATPAGDLWVAYFDEGVFGNYGWGAPDGPEPVGWPGLIRFSSELRAQWRFPSHGTATSFEAISDCYALNVDGETAWACYYTDFPIVRVRDGIVRSWRNDVPGATALAVGDSRVALFGGYGADHDRLSVGVLGDDALHITGRFRIVLPDGRPLPARRRTVGRGPDLHVLTADHWYRLGVDDIPRG